MSAFIAHLKYFIKEIHFSLFGNKGAFKQVYSDTVVAVEKSLPEHVCAELIAKIEDLIAKPGKNLWHDDVGSDVRIWGFEEHIPNQLEFLGIEQSLADISDYLGTNVGDWLLMANKTIPAAGGLGSGGGFHRDSAFSHQIKIIWYLSDVSAKNGPFSHVPGSHRDLFAKGSILKPPHTRVGARLIESVHVTGEAGLKLIADTRCIHGGIPIEVGARYAITLYTVTKRNGLKLQRSEAGLAH